MIHGAGNFLWLRSSQSKKDQGKDITTSEGNRGVRGQRERRRIFRGQRSAGSNKRVCKALSRVQLFMTQRTVAHRAPLSLGFSRQEYCSGLPFPSPGDLLDPGIEPTSPVFPALAGGFSTTEPPGKLGSLIPRGIYLCCSFCLQYLAPRVPLVLSSDSLASAAGSTSSGRCHLRWSLSIS